MRWGIIRIVIFACAFLVGLLIFNSGPPVELTISAVPAEHKASESGCRGNRNLILTNLQQGAVNAGM
jgi:hypothetical protein